MDDIIRCPELPSVHSTAGMNNNSFLRSVDATSVNFQSGEFHSVGATDAGRRQRFGRSDDVTNVTA